VYPCQWNRLSSCTTVAYSFAIWAIPGNVIVCTGIWPDLRICFRADVFRSCCFVSIGCFVQSTVVKLCTLIQNPSYSLLHQRVRAKIIGVFCAVLCTIVHSAMLTHINTPNSCLVVSFLCGYIVLQFITRRRSWSFDEYCKHFVALLNDVHAFGYNSAGSERIWMKFGALGVYCLEMSLTNFEHDPRRSGSGSASQNFVFFCPLNNARFHQLPVGQISRNLHKKTCFCVRMCRFGKHLWKFARKGSFFPNNSHFCLIKVNDFRLPAAISPKWLQILESRDGLARLWNVGFPLTPLEWTQSDSPGLLPLNTESNFFPKKILFYDVHRRRLHGMLHNTECCK